MKRRARTNLSRCMKSLLIGFPFCWLAAVTQGAETRISVASNFAEPA